MTTTKIEPRPLQRPLRVIAEEIRATWVKASKSDPRVKVLNVHYTAKPYWQAMLTLDSLSDMYFNDPATHVVRYFLSNASAFRGEDARRIKAELEAGLAWHAGARS